MSIWRATNDKHFQQNQVKSNIASSFHRKQITRQKLWTRTRTLVNFHSRIFARASVHNSTTPVKFNTCLDRFEFPPCPPYNTQNLMTKNAREPWAIPWSLHVAQEPTKTRADNGFKSFWHVIKRTTQTTYLKLHKTLLVTSVFCFNFRFFSLVERSRRKISFGLCLLWSANDKGTWHFDKWSKLGAIVWFLFSEKNR